jgi:hypothetical protein
MNVFTCKETADARPGASSLRRVGDLCRHRVGADVTRRRSTRGLRDRPYLPGASLAPNVRSWRNLRLQPWTAFRRIGLVRLTPLIGGVRVCCSGTRSLSDSGAEEGRQHAIGCVDVVAQCETDRRSIARAKRCKHELVLLVRLEVIAGCVEEMKIRTDLQP